MTLWLDMQEQQFDRTLAKDKAAREFIATAGETLFPSLLPEAAPNRKAAQEATAGDLTLFDPGE